MEANVAINKIHSQKGNWPKDASAQSRWPLSTVLVDYFGDDGPSHDGWATLVMMVRGICVIWGTLD